MERPASGDPGATATTVKLADGSPAPRRGGDLEKMIPEVQRQVTAGGVVRLDSPPFEVGEGGVKP